MRSLGAKKSPRLPHSKRPNPGWGGDRQAQWPERRFEAHRGVGQTGFWVKSWDFILKCEGFERFNLQPSRKIHPPILPKFAWLSWKKDQTRVRRTLSQTFFLQERSVTVWASRSVLRTKSSTGMEHGTVQWLCPCSRCSLWWPQEAGSRDHITWCVNGVPRKMTIIKGEMMIHMIRQCLDMISDSRSWHSWDLNWQSYCASELMLPRMVTSGSGGGSFRWNCGVKSRADLGLSPFSETHIMPASRSCIVSLAYCWWSIFDLSGNTRSFCCFPMSTCSLLSLSDLDLGNPPRPRRVRFAFSEAQEVSHWGAPRAMQFQDFTIGIVHFMHFILGTWRFMTTNGQLWSNWEWRNIVKSQKPPVYGLFSMEYHADLGLLAPQFFGRTHIPMIVHCIPILLIASITQFFLAT